MAEMTSRQFQVAKDAGAARLRGPRAETAAYDGERNRIVIRLTTRVELAFEPSDVEGLQHASATDLSAVQVEAFGLAIHFPTLDCDLYVPALLEGVLGSQRWMAARLQPVET